MEVQRLNILDSLMNDACFLTASNFLQKLKFEFGCDIVDGPEEEHGVHIVNVRAGTPADDAGLRRWDVVEGVDGVPVASCVEFKQVLNEKGAGSTVVLSVHRGRPGAVDSCPVIVELGIRGGFPSHFVTDARRIVKERDVRVDDWPVWYCPFEKRRAKLAAAHKVVERVRTDFYNVRPELGLGFVNGPEGAHVVFVLEQSPADKAGAMVDDIIEAVDGVDICDTSMFKQVVKSIRPGDIVVLHIRRGEKGGVTKGELQLIVGARNANLSWLSRAHRVCAGVVFAEDLQEWSVTRHFG